MLQKIIEFFFGKNEIIANNVVDNTIEFACCDVENTSIPQRLVRDINTITLEHDIDMELLRITISTYDNINIVLSYTYNILEYDNTYYEAKDMAILDYTGIVTLMYDLNSDGSKEPKILTKLNWESLDV